MAQGAIEVGRENFEDVVIKGSAATPVLVDFWAPWCGPCRALGPVLDRLADAYAGRFTLAKLDTDRDPELATRYGVRGIPSVKLFSGGEVVDEFTGALPEGRVRAFLDARLPSPVAPLLAAARAHLERRDAIGALGKLDAAFAIDPDDEDALLTRAEVMLALDRRADAGAILAAFELPSRIRERPVRDERRLAALKARIALVESGGADLDALAAAASRTPVDCAAKLAYARSLAAAGDYERALSELLAIVVADRRFQDDVGRRTMLTIFAALPGDHDLVRRYRRELAAAINR